jgi:hypothetical protein
VFVTTTIAVVVLGACYAAMQAALRVSGQTRESQGAQF